MLDFIGFYYTMNMSAVDTATASHRPAYRLGSAKYARGRHSEFLVYCDVKVDHHDRAMHRWSAVRQLFAMRV